MWRAVYRRFLGLALAAGGLFVATQTFAQTRPPVVHSGNFWTTANGTLQGTRYSPLAEINAGNAGRLIEEFAFPTGVANSHQGSPLVVGRVMYVVTPFPNKLIALDLNKPGTTLWTFEPNPGLFAQGLTCCDVVNRGAAYGVIRSGPLKGLRLIVYALLDGNVVAVDADKGTQVWRRSVADPWTGETLNTAPLIVKDKVILGSSGAEMGIRGSLRALDLATGRPVWRAYSTGPDAEVLIDSTTRPWFAKDRGANLGQTSWPGALWRNGGATAWAWLTYDPDTDTIFYGTSQPGTFNPTMRKPGENKWGSSIFARNPDTGIAKWVYQLTPWDNWDYDSVNENTVVDLPLGANGALRKVIVHFDKNGFEYILDRVTGELIQAAPFSDMNWASGVDLSTGYPKINASKLTVEGARTSYICPSAFGAKDWEHSAYSPKTGLFYFGAFNLCMDYEPIKVNYIASTPFIGADVAITLHRDRNNVPEANMGEFVAFDPVTGKRAWTIKEPKPIFGGALTTAGDIVFYGTLDKKFKAVDAKTGKVLFSKALECGITSAPITYRGPDGQQRVAVTTGLGWLNGGFSGSGPCPQTSMLARRSAQAEMAVNFAAEQGGAEAAKQAAPEAAPTSGYVHVFKLPWELGGSDVSPDADEQQ